MKHKTFEHHADSLETLRKISPLSYGIERVFHILTRISPERLFGPTRVQIQKRFAKSEDRLVAARNRGRRIEFYLLLWLAIEASAVVFGTGSQNAWVTWLFSLAVCVRIADIIQITGNISLFDRLKINWRYYYIENTVRIILLSLVNYMEFIVCFGFLYCVMGRDGHGLVFKDSIYDGYYFSGVTQLTIGYGDIIPRGGVKYLALFQGFIGFLFTILILGRFISLLPEITDDVK
jgi:potassium channel LctB